jgi:transcriptional regulator with XRE-family HTH domain
VRRLRLANELKAARTALDLTHDQLAKKIGQSRQQISRLENGHVAPSQDDMMTILGALSVNGTKWSQMLAIAQDAATKGWWEPTARAMDERQRMFADLEAGAVEIGEYQQSLEVAEVVEAEVLR